MPTNAQLHLEDATEPIVDVRVHRLECLDALNQPFLFTLGLTSTDLSIEPAQVLGMRAVVDLEGVLAVGCVDVALRRRAAVAGPTSGESAYEAVLSAMPTLRQTHFVDLAHERNGSAGFLQLTELRKDRREFRSNCSRGAVLPGHIRA